MNIIRRRFGLYWSANFPPVNWRDMLMVLQAIATLLLAYIAVSAIEQAGASEATADRATKQAAQAETNLLACLNGQPLIHETTAIFCQTKEIQL